MGIAASASRVDAAARTGTELHLYAGWLGYGPCTGGITAERSDYAEADADADVDVDADADIDAEADVDADVDADATSTSNSSANNDNQSNATNNIGPITVHTPINIYVTCGCCGKKHKCRIDGMNGDCDEEDEEED